MTKIKSDDHDTKQHDRVAFVTDFPKGLPCSESCLSVRPGPVAVVVACAQLLLGSMKCLEFYSGVGGADPR